MALIELEKEGKSPPYPRWDTPVKRISSTVLRLLAGSGHVRSGQLRTNAILSMVFRFLSMCIGVLLVPLTLDYLDVQKYGIWLTLTSVVAWFSLFDIGLGHGLRNRLAEAIARDDRELARTYVATAYTALSAIGGILCVGFFGVAPFLNWGFLLNANQVPSGELTALVLVVFFGFSVRFVSSLINIVLSADQRTWHVSGYEALANLLTLGGVLLITHTTTGSLIALGATLSLISAFVPAAVSLYLYSGRYRWLRPRISEVRTERFKEIASLGSKFFFLNIVGILQFGVQNILISHLVGQSGVAAYNVGFKYFSLITMFYGTAMLPLWPAFTEAFAKRDMVWIQGTVRNVLKIWCGVAFLCLLMLAVSPLIYPLWVGDALKIDFTLSLVIGAYVLLTTWGTVFTMFVNGLGKVKLQMIFAGCAAMANIPLAIVFVKYFGLGSVGIVLSTVVCMLPAAVLTPLQYYKLANGRATGIWNA